MCDVFNYADDNSLSFHHHNPLVVQNTLESACKVALDWFSMNYNKANPQKFQSIILSRRPQTSKPYVEYHVNDVVIKLE